MKKKLSAFIFQYALHIYFMHLQKLQKQDFLASYWCTVCGWIKKIELLNNNFIFVRR